MNKYICSAINHKNISNERNALHDMSQVFKKRGGTTDKGKDYEHLYIAYLVLKLTIDDEVENFYLSSNDEKYGSFDDVVVEIKLNDRTEIFACQLKHVNKKILNVEQLNATTGNFSIEKYNTNFKRELKQLKQPVKMVLLTNCKLSTEKLNQFKFGKLKECKQNELMRTSEFAGNCHVFETGESNVKEYEEFFANFYLYTDQLDVQQLNKRAFETFKTHFGSDETAFNEYVRFITQWSMKEGKKNMLDKIWMKRIISLCVFSPFVNSLSFDEDKSVSRKREAFREAISKFDVTVVDKSNFEKIETIWSRVVKDLDDVENARKVSNKYQLFDDVVKTKDDLYNKDQLKLSKLMWLLGESPLVLEGTTQVYQTMKICQTQNVVILVDKENFKDIVLVKTSSCFQTLSDLKINKHLYETIISNLTYSLEGQNEMSLKHLLEICKDADNFISTDDIIEMLDVPLLIGNQKENLPPSHIERKLTKILIDVKFLKKIDSNTTALVTGVKDAKVFRQMLPNLVIKEINNVEYINETNFNHKVYICEDDIPKQKFATLCVQDCGKKFHQFRYLDNHRLEWIASGGSIEEGRFLKEFDEFRLQNEFMEYTIHESQFFNEPDQDVNIICADPGMGKSTLMKSLKNSRPSSKWVILIYARNHALYFRKHHKLDGENFLTYILDATHKKYANVFYQEVFKTMIGEKKIELIWDGLDEASDFTQRAILTLVKYFAEKGVQQWLTSRNNLKSMLESELNMFSRNIKQFDDDEQQEYIKNRLRITDKQVSEIFIKIKKNIMAFPNFEILGIPLQIYMLTELFLKDKEKYVSLLETVFTVVDLYEHFVEEKFNILSFEKNNIDLTKENNYQNFEDKKNKKMECYKSVAANTYIYNSLMGKFWNKLFGSDKNIEKFVEEIRNVGDDVGFISSVTSKNDIEFSHNSYGEYFAALYLFENEPSKARDRKFISESRFTNIRFFLDLMFSKSSKCFIALIYKNPQMLKECTITDLNVNDSIGRNVLEVACAWSKNYPLVAKNVLLSDNSFRQEAIINNNLVIKGLNYSYISQLFSKNSPNDVRFKKLLLFLPFLVPFYDGKQFHDDNLPMVLYYAIKFDFPMIFECIENSPQMKHTYNNISSRSILALALFNRSRHILQKLFSEERKYFEWDCVEDLKILDSEVDEIFTFVLQLQGFEINVPNSKGQFLTHYACEKNLVKTMRSPVLKTANFNTLDSKKKRPIHIAYEKGHLHLLKLIAAIDVFDIDGRLPLHYGCAEDREDIIECLLDNGAKVNVPDRNGRLPIFYACTNLYEDVISLLVKKGAKIDVPDTDGTLLIHHVCKRWNADLIKLLLSNGTGINVPDGDGRLPIHYACQHWDEDVVRLLVEHGTKVDVPDIDGSFPLHHACRQWNTDLIKLLLANGAKANIPDVDGQLPIHYACQHWDADIMKELLESGAKVDVPDESGRLPIHYAYKNFDASVIQLLVMNGAKVDVPDVDGTLPIHYACENWNSEVLALFVANGAELKVPGRFGKLPMHYACAHLDIKIIKLLLRNGASVNDVDAEGRLPIHYACENLDVNRPKVVKLLIMNGAKIDVPDGHGRLPLPYTCEITNRQTIKLLLSAEVDVLQKEFFQRLGDEVNDLQKEFFQLVFLLLVALFFKGKAIYLPILLLVIIVIAMLCYYYFVVLLHFLLLFYVRMNILKKADDTRRSWCFLLWFLFCYSLFFCNLPSILHVFFYYYYYRYTSLLLSE